MKQILFLFILFFCTGLQAGTHIVQDRQESRHQITQNPYAITLKANGKPDIAENLLRAWFLIRQIPADEFDIGTESLILGSHALNEYKVSRQVLSERLMNLSAVQARKITQEEFRALFDAIEEKASRYNITPEVPSSDTSTQRLRYIISIADNLNYLKKLGVDSYKMSIPNLFEPSTEVRRIANQIARDPFAEVELYSPPNKLQATGIEITHEFDTTSITRLLAIDPQYLEHANELLGRNVRHELHRRRNTIRMHINQGIPGINQR